MSDVLSKADALIQRRRVQLGGVPEPQAAHWPDDIPVLTDVVDDAPSQTFSVADKHALHDAIRHELDAWLDENLPQIVVHLLDGIGDTLIRHLHESAREDLLPRLEQALSDRARDAAQQAAPL